jgi:DNA-binding CsgD family transcriptional regulator
MNDEDLVRTQRALRGRLFEGASAIRWRPGRELAAQLLLYLDDPQACWRLTADWLRDTLDADRVDGGFGGFVVAQAHHDYIAVAESQRPTLRLPDVAGRRFDAGNAALRAVWQERDLLAIEDVSREAMPADMRGTLKSIGTAAKIALPVRDGARPVGLLCADWHRSGPRWNAQACLEAARFARDALGTLIGAAQTLAQDAPDDDAPDAWRGLTAAELRVARLVALGLSYKEVARQLDRSLSTVDHQLRSIRRKLGVASTSRLVRLLSEGAAAQAPAPGRTRRD